MLPVPQSLVEVEDSALNDDNKIEFPAPFSADMIADAKEMIAVVVLRCLKETEIKWLKYMEQNSQKLKITSPCGVKKRIDINITKSADYRSQTHRRSLLYEPS